MPKSKTGFAGLSKARRAVWKQLAPPPRLSVSQWAERFRYLSPEASAASGRWSNKKTPYLVDIMDAFNNPRCEEIYVQSGAQLGKTELLLNIMGFVIHYQPSPCLVILPNQTLAEAMSKDRVAPMIRDTPVLNERVDDPKSRDSSNTIGHKAFVGGHLSIVTGGSVSNLAMRPIRIVIADELDRLAVTKEGNALDLAKKRTETFYDAKVFATSTPADGAQTSQIHAAYRKSRMHVYLCPCPQCEEFFEWKWEHVGWINDDPKTAHIECPACHYPIIDKERKALVRQGRWHCENPEAGEFQMGFKMSSLISPWVKVKKLVKKFLDARGNPAKQKAFVNTDLGECYEEETEGIAHSDIYAKREQYEHPAPEGVLVITCGVDIGADHAHLEFIGWGEGEESWSLDYVKLYGNPAKKEFWDEIDDQLMRRFESWWGWSLPVASAFIDSGGHYTNESYEYVKDKRHRRIYVCKGIKGWGKPVIANVSKRTNRGKSQRVCDLITLCVSEAKSSIYQRLKLAPGLGACHFPVLDAYDPSYFKMLVAEEIKTVFRNGYPERVWILPEHRRCEALDCRVYGYAALIYLNASFEGIKKRYISRKRLMHENEEREKIAKEPKEIKPIPALRVPKVLEDIGRLL